MKTSKGREQHPYQMPALIALTAILGAQIVWIVWQLMTAGFAFAALWRPVAFTIVFLLVAVTRGRMRVINTLGRVMIAVAFLSALWNRFDDFSRFIRYAGLVLSFMPPAIVPFLPVIATAVEVGLCIAMFCPRPMRCRSSRSSPPVRISPLGIPRTAAMRVPIRLPAF